MAADVGVIQECAKPPGESTRCLWSGDNTDQGVLVVVAPEFHVRRLPPLDGVPKFVIPFGISGPVADFTLLAVWAKGESMSAYVRGVFTAVGMYRDLILSAPCVLMGDLNSSVAYLSQCTAAYNHSVLIALLKSLALSSAYHGFFGEAQGLETRPTYYARPQRNKPFHIDYCFLPDAWMNRVTQVAVGAFDDWHGISDHRPLSVDLDFN
jgi:exodeoxyribonuclease III